MNKDMITLSRDELKDLIKEAVAEAFFEAGLRTDEHEHIEEARKDFAFIRRLRMSADGVASKIGWAVLSVLGTGVVYALWTGFRVTVKAP